jgi:uncharacterized protein (DUF885 family)
MHRPTRRHAVLMTGAALAAPALSPAQAASAADQAFAALSHRWLEAWLRASPVTASGLGDHRFDSALDDMSPAGRAAAIAQWRALLAELGGIDRKSLSRDNQVDAAMLETQLRYAIWDDQVLKSWSWDALVWSQLAGQALYVLIARNFAPLPSRLLSATARMQELPGLLAQMRASLVPGHVPAIHATTVARQNSGLMDIVDSMILPQAHLLPAAQQVTLKDAATALRRAAAQHQAWLDKTLVPQAKGDFRIGAKLFDQKLAFTLDSPLSRKDIRARAEAAIKAVRAQMYALANKALGGAGPAAPDAATQQRIIKAALDKAAANHPARAHVVDAARAILAEATSFVRAKNLITLPDAPVELIIMPKFQQGVEVAYCDPPGPLDAGQKTFYAVSPIPVGWTPAQTDSFLREYNNYGLADITVHEAMPGHYVQLWHSNKCPSKVRGVLSSGSFVEGWAVYAENLMAGQGFHGDDPLYRLTQLKVYLRTITNAVLDQAIHCDGMSEKDAMRLMTQTAFQEEREAAGKWTRARLSATQLSTYFVGRQEHDGLRARAEKRPGFSLKAYHDQVLSYGSPPARYAGALMFGDAI